MRDRFFKPAVKMAKLSPFFLFKTLCGMSLLRDFYIDYNNGKKIGNADCAQLLRALVALRFILPSVQRVKINYAEYQHASRFLQEYGYRKKWANYFIDSTCGRQQLKMACQEQGHLNSYKQHLKAANVKWYHIDQKKSLRLMFPIDFVIASTAVVVSHQTIDLVAKISK